MSNSEGYTIQITKDKVNHLEMHESSINYIKS